MTLPPAPAVPQIPAGWKPVQADMDSWVTTPFSFLAAPAVFRGQLQAAGTAASGWRLMQLDTVLEDPYTGWSATLTASQPAFSWLCPAGCSGWYEVSVTGHTANQGGAADTAAVAVYLDGSLYSEAAALQAPNGTPSGCSGAVMVPLLAGIDYLQMFLFSTASVAAPATAGQFPTMEIAWISS
jgi:hypothetical protein